MTWQAFSGRPWKGGSGGPRRALVEQATAEVGRCRLNPVEARFERDWFQCLKLTYDEPLSNFAFNFNLCRYTTELAVVGGGSSHCPGSSRATPQCSTRL